MPDTNPHRLPRVVVPERYELLLSPDLDAGTFTGSASIEVAVTEPVDEIVLNAAELTILEVSVTTVAEEACHIEDVEEDGDREHVTVRLGEPLDPGEYTLHFEFEGALNDKLRGFYRSTYETAEGDRRTLATTQFEPTDARRAFPCFDEPDFRARFAVTLDVPEGMAAFSNGRVLSEERAERRGRKRVRFAETIPMSTYLVAFVVGELDATGPVDVEGTPLRVVHVPGKAHLTEFALEVGEHALRFFADYYGIPYPADKLDLLAIPDFAAGAMENLGCVTFREALLLVDPAKSTQAELTRIADVVAHEIAHTWFGDLVTMKWWNGLWLNEAFATFMEVAAVAAFRPEWERWSQFALERSAAFDVDALETTRPIEYPVESPEDAEGMFDILTYEKGASVLRMLEQYLGPETFREGIRHYLRKHELGNTETTDLFDAIEEKADAPVRRIMDTWIFQGGFPLVRAAADGGRLRLEQARMSYRPSVDGSRWEIPVLVRAIGEDGAGTVGAGRTERLLLSEEPASVTLEGAAACVVNSGGHGYYRVAYDAGLAAALARRLAELEPVERYALVDDAWAFVMSGEGDAAGFLQLLDGYREVGDLDIWRLAAGCLGALDRLVDGAARDALRARVREMLALNISRLGWDPSPDEPGLDRQLRGVLIRTLGIIGNDDDTYARARSLHTEMLADPDVLSGDVAAAVVAVVASKGDASDWDTFVRLSKDSQTPQEKLRYLHSLVEFPGEDEFRRTLDHVLSDEVKTQDAPFVIAGLIGHRDHGPIAWDRVASEWEAINGRFPSNTIVRMAAGVKALGLSHPHLAPDVREFFAEHEIPQARQTLAQHLEKLKVNVALRERESGRLATWLVR
ncbi:MAG: M1 family peptidase [Actinobacteria bacterium ATB1]|nr:M1 family peptidase [Actinobacteria bacterium ATB1]